MKNIEFSSPETDRRIMLRVSFAFMALLWLFCIAVLALIARAAYTDDMFHWDTKRYLVAGCCSLLSLVVIPIQLARYVRQMRASR
jgi:succinate dehydrogenase hydrophobic anchor subunit